ncbi:MAG: sn-glycerol-3-phosphate ABC transporter ATP-binding protein UgpC [bacterium]|nr:sn-glycerol-3-phosphate ABC transporter ATP-binding protein UgpC [bacterium]
MSEVKLEKIEKVYPNGFKAVHGVDLEVKDGEFMVLVGPSGCAKSTVLRMIAGLEEITEGTLKIGNKVVNNLDPKDRGIAMVFQNYALYPHMTVYNNMAFGLKLRKMPKKDIDMRVREAAAKLEIEDLLDRKPKDMSGGQRQRVAVGRAIVRKPDVFLFDEPLSNLDAKLRVSMRVRLVQLHQQLKEEGQTATMIYVTHDQVEAMTMGDRICVLKEGLIMQVDKPLNLYKSPANKFVAGFIGSPAMNLIEADMFKKDKKVYLSIGKHEFELPKAKADTMSKRINIDEKKKVWFGLRPEDVESFEAHPGSTNYIDGKISLLEQMGNETFCYFTTGGNNYTARLESSKISELQIGDDYKFYLKLDNCHIFDYDTEENISLG